ncbi:MAG: hypothetical protein IPH58_13930 [Sphingobacteriales bacterium]|nr:hypothetical protein [Sphingobacteriales bacterium]
MLYDNAIADFHQGTQMISEYAGVYEQEGVVQYIANRLPIFAHGKDDLHSFRYITSNLIHQKLCRKVDIERGFHVNPDTVSCWYKKFKEQGERAFLIRITERVPLTKFLENAKNVFKRNRIKVKA